MKDNNIRQQCKCHSSKYVSQYIVGQNEVNGQEPSQVYLYELSSDGKSHWVVNTTDVEI